MNSFMLGFGWVLIVGGSWLAAMALIGMFFEGSSKSGLLDTSGKAGHSETRGKETGRQIALKDGVKDEDFETAFYKCNGFLPADTLPRPPRFLRDTLLDPEVMGPALIDMMRKYDEATEINKRQASMEGLSAPADMTELDKQLWKEDILKAADRLGHALMFDGNGIEEQIKRIYEIDPLIIQNALIDVMAERKQFPDHYKFVFYVPHNFTRPTIIIDPEYNEYLKNYPHGLEMNMDDENVHLYLHVKHHLVAPEPEERTPTSGIIEHFFTKHENNDEQKSE